MVVVANIQMRTLKTEVEKGSVGTAVGNGLVDPNWYLNGSNSSIYVNVQERESG